MRTSELARLGGVNIETVRYYERRKLLREPTRSTGGYREYTLKDLESLRFIKRCQLLGFSLKEIEQLAELHQAIPRCAGKEPTARAVNRFLRLSDARLQTIDEKIAALQAMRSDLMKMAQELRRTQGEVCPAARR